MTRRHMIQAAAEAAGVLGLAGSAALALAESKAKRFKVGACQWSLRRSDATCFRVAKEIGLDGVQVDMGRASNGLWLRQPEIQRAYLEAAQGTGVEIASLAMAELNNVALKSEPRAAVWLVDAIDVTKTLGVNVLLIAQFHQGDLRNDKQGVDRTVELLREVAPRAERAKVILGLENYLSAEQNLEIIQRVGSAAVQVYYDVGNSTDMGYDIGREIRLLKGRICEFHAKDGNHMLGQGRVDFAKVRDAIDDIGYDGWIQIEAAAPLDLTRDYKAHLAVLRQHFGN